ncbi:potassium channel subfamily K member 13a [Leucoraja erinacea]|uniref:potassium channel subfamily K member 13a n=1 Tax=Leucoraja erinaceus TaxID=7782 RepID=UPI002453CC34|nr:potassium channel subfamily K member 13a [Leucoraja erinacea]
MAARWGCSSHLNEDNARFALLALLICFYLVCGAAVFSAMERGREKEAQRQWLQRRENFSRRHNISRAELSAFLRHYEEAGMAGVRVDETRPRWDFAGSFYFVGTVVSTIGFGMTTPATASGKIFLIFYGLLGCAATILFFNLFLERLITVLAFALKTCHERRLRRSGVRPQLDLREDGGGSGGLPAADSLSGWKPSVYCVMLILGLAALTISCCASAMYTPVEGWTYMDSIYFCFVAFSTIGFGDLVSSQNLRYDHQEAYRLANFLFILMGVCCIYSLFNVISIVIKQFLNCTLRRLASRCRRRPGRRPLRPAGNAVAPGRPKISADADPFNECDGRRQSGEMISIRDFMAANKVSLAIMQKQLMETAGGHPRAGSAAAASRANGFSEGVGALAIMNNRLVETSVDR